MTPLPPGSTIGILGGGQLGRMLAVAAAQLGYRTHVLAPDAESVAAQTAGSFTRADYHSRIVLDEFAAIGGRPAILEGFVAFGHEFSIILARGHDGAMVSYPPPWNEHKDGILARSSLPAPAEIAAQWGEAAALAGRVADRLGYVGVLACE